MEPLTKRQREILNHLADFIQQNGYAPSLEEIGQRFGLSSLATVHKHLTNLEEKGFIRRSWNKSRSVEIVPTDKDGAQSRELDLMGYVAAGQPIEAIVTNESIAVPEMLIGKNRAYVLRVKGDSMIDEQIRDGDYVIVEDRKTAENGEVPVVISKAGMVAGVRFDGEQPLVKINGDWMVANKIMGMSNLSERRFGQATPLPLKEDLLPAATLVELQRRQLQVED